MRMLIVLAAVMFASVLVVPTVSLAAPQLVQII
jgi:hypothetical protein